MSKEDMHEQDKVYFLGAKEKRSRNNISPRIWIILGIGIIAVIAIILIHISRPRHPEYYYEPEHRTQHGTVIPGHNETGTGLNNESHAYIEVREETVNDVPVYLYIPHHAEMTLAVGMPDKADSTIIFTAQAADIRADNLDIVGDFVLAGKQLARGTAKTGFCAVVNGKITIGSTGDTPLLQKAIESGGYFFRQYPLVSNGTVIENTPKNKSIRRALAIKNEQAVMFESRSPESFHDFAQALADMGVSDAVYLVGSIAYGWYFDQEKKRYEFGTEKDDLPPGTSYIVWRKK